MGYTVEGGHLSRVYAVGAYTERCNIEFPSSEHMWSFLKHMKGRKLPSVHAESSRPDHPDRPNHKCLWHSIDTYPEEIARAARCRYARELVT
eukprot:3448521-Pyramimonas_sp.AAC.1